jgi:hypothetical protein
LANLNVLEWSGLKQSACRESGGWRRTHNREHDMHKFILSRRYAAMVCQANPVTVLFGFLQM